MQYPNITLEIKNQIASIQLRKNENDVQTVITSNVGIDSLMMKIAELVGQDYQGIEDIMQSLGEGDWQYLEFPEIKFSDEKIDLEVILPTVEKSEDNFQIPTEVDGSELKAQLLANWRSDVLASSLEEIYNILIGSTVFLASEMAVTNIVLADATQSTRLREKMAKELAAVEEIEFYIS